MVPRGNFCDTTLKRLGVETSYYAPNADIAPLLKPNTKAVFCESPGSLTFEIQDIPAIAKTAHAHGASVLMDNTWATPLLFDAHGHGVDLSIQAGTKYLGGHADVKSAMSAPMKAMPRGSRKPTAIWGCAPAAMIASWRCAAFAPWRYG